MSIEDIKKFAKQKNILISDSDSLILYNYIKNHYMDFLEKEDILIRELKNKLSPNTFKEAYKLYLEYKIKYLS